MLMIVLTVAVGGGALFWAHKQTQARQRVWKQIAAARGGRFVPADHGFFQKQYEGIEAQVAHAVVFLDLHVVSNGKSSTTYTRARARFALGRGPRFRIYEEGVFSTLGKALGTQDLEIGVPAFDQRFMIKGDDSRAIAEAWTDDAVSGMSQLRNARAESDETWVTVTVFGGISDATVLNRMLDLAGELASVGAWELDRLAAELPDATLEAAHGDWQSPRRPSVRFETPRGPVVGTMRYGAGEHRLRLSLRAEDDKPTFSADIQGGEATELPKGLLTERAATVLRKIESATLSAHGADLQLAFPYVPEDAMITAGTTLLAELAGGTRSVGAFR